MTQICSACRYIIHTKHDIILPKLFAYWLILHAFLSSADFFQNQLFQKILSGIGSECKTVWIHIRPRVYKLEYSLKLKIKRNNWSLADTGRQAANHCFFLSLRMNSSLITLRPGPTKCRAWSGSRLFASYQQTTLVGKRLKVLFVDFFWTSIHFTIF